MSDPGDPLDEAMAAFRAAPAPAPVRELFAEAEATRRVVAWLSAALAAQSPPAARPAAAVLRRAARPRWRLLSGRPALAAAAVLLLLLGAALWLADGDRRSAVTPPAPVASGEPPSAPAPAEPAPLAPASAEDRPAPGLVAVSEGRLELRSGPVRLLLFVNDDSHPSEDLR